MSTLLQDHFRCPEGFDGILHPDLSHAHTGFFRLGPASLGFGRVAQVKTAGRPDQAQDDALHQVAFGPEGCRLPFNPDEIVDNLRLERYPGVGHAAGAGSLPRRLAESVYYTLRPLLGVAVRKHLQRSVVLKSSGKQQFPAWHTDTTVERILDCLLLIAMRARGVKRVPFIWYWPDGYRYVVAMTHDVESLAGRDFTESLMDLDDRFGLKAAFEIIPERRYQIPESWLASIRQRGFEINVHDLNHDGRLFSNHREFLRRVEKINAYGRAWGARGFRSAVLYRNLRWFDALQFDYDMSLPTGAHYHPQRGGCCTVRPYFIGNLVELPGSGIQDYILFHILGDYSTTIWEEQMEAIAAAHGVLCFSVHPDYVMERRACDVYTALLEKVAAARQGGDLWTPLPRDLCAWWRLRNAMRLVADGEKWRIEGEGAERAHVAYAEDCDGELRYVIPARDATLAHSASRGA